MPGSDDDKKSNLRAIPGMSPSEQLARNYAKTKLASSVSGFAVSAKTLPERLAEAWTSHLHVLTDENFPTPDTGRAFAAIRARVTAIAPLGNEMLEGAIARMPMTDARSVIEEVVELYSVICAGGRER